MARAQRRKFHYIYKITNRLNGKFYIGMHSTDSLGDGYFGSGKYLWNSIKKHGKENHEMEIIEHYFSREDLAAREKELVNKELLKNEMCMNIRLGGDGGGGWDHIKNDEKMTEIRRQNIIIAREKLVSDEEKFNGWRKHRSKSMKRNHESGKMRYDTFVGRTHSEETKEKMRKPKNLGESNSQFGTCWICNGDEAKKIKKEELQSWIEQGWSKGRKLPS